MARTTIRTGDITDSSVTAVKLSSTAITDKLGYTPLQSSDLNNYVTLTGTATLTNKTAQNLILTGTLSAGASVGSSGQYLQSTGSGVQWVTLSVPSSNSFANIAVAGQTTVAADSSTDTLTLVAGTGITLSTDGATDTITITGIATTNSFSTIAVSGHSNVVADTNSDTLTLLASSGIDISTNATTDTITVTNTGVTSVNGLTGSVSAQNILDAVKTLDGASSGLDADLLDGNDGSYYQQALGYTPVNKAGDTMTGILTLSGAPTSNLHAATKQYVDTAVSNNGNGDVVGPASATSNAIARFDSTTGKLLKNSLVTISDTGAIVAPAVASIIPFYYDNQSQFPSASTYHGALAHSHADGKVYFAHAGAWNALANSTDITTSETFKTIAVSGQTSVVADSGTDTLTLVAGTNITITTDAATDSITINSTGGGGGASETFKTIAVNGQSSVVADSSTDTLTLVAGTGITITTDASTDTITINSTGGGGGGNSGISTVVDKFTGDGTTTAYTLSATPANEDHTIVVMEGVVQFKDTYTVSGNVLTFSAAPFTGYNIEITTFSSVIVNSFANISVAGQSNVVADSSSDTLTLSAGSGIAITTTAGTDTISIGLDSTVATLIGTETLTNKTLTSPTINSATANNLTLTGTLTANAAVGSAGQVLKSTGTGVQWANESGGSSFSTITVAGQTNVVADSASDTLTIVAGDNIVITTDATTDTITISSSGGSVGAGDEINRVVDDFTATAGQTTFTSSQGYIVGNIDVYYNGIRLVSGSDYTATNGTTVVLASPATAGSAIQLISWKFIANTFSPFLLMGA